MQRGADPRGGVKGVNKAHQGGEQVLPLEDLRPQILAAGPEHIAEHRHHLGHDDELLQVAEVVHIAEKGVEQRAEDQEIPAHIEDQEKLVEGDQVVQPAVDGRAALPGDQVLRDEVHDEVEDPATQQLHVGKTGLVQPPQGEAPVVHGAVLQLFRLLRAVHGIVPPGDVGVGHHGVQGLGLGDAGDLVHEPVADPIPFLLDGGVGPEWNRLAEEQGLQLRRHIERHKAQGLAGLFVVEPGQIHKLLLKGVDDVVVLVIALGEDDDAAARLQAADALPEGGDQPGVVVDGDGVGVIEDQQRQRHDQMAQELEEPAGALGLARPEIPVGVGRHLLPVHHLPGAPDVVGAGNVKLPRDGAVHMAVVAHDDAGLLRQLLRALQAVLGGKKPDKPADDLVKQTCFFLFHLISFAARDRRANVQSV